MSFSDKDVLARLRRNFVCAWVNLEGDPIAGESYAHPPGDPPPHCVRGNGEHNVQMLVLTPSGEIVSALSGYLSPQTLGEELDLAAALVRDLAGAEEVDVELRERVVALRHEAFAKELAEREWPELFGEFEKARALSDHQFAQRHPLLHFERFRPEMLVGNARTFFGSSSGGTPSERIGGDGDGPRTGKGSGRDGNLQ